MARTKLPRKKSRKIRKANPYVNFNKAVTKYFETHIPPFNKKDRKKWCSTEWKNLNVRQKELCQTETGADALVKTRYKKCKGIPEVLLDKPKAIAIGKAKPKAKPPATSRDHQSPTHTEEQANQELFDLGYTEDDISSVETEIMRVPPNVDWDEITDLEVMKKRLFEATTLALIFPGYFTGIRTPYKGVLLFGPPGTGKTMAVRAVVTECNNSYQACSFFNVKASSIASPYQGISENKMRLIFEMARLRSPSIIMIDELDALCTQRGGARESESSRKVLAELLMQMDGIDTSDTSRTILVIACTNRPWDLDDALIRRFEKRLYIPAPEKPAIIKMLERNLHPYQKADDVDLAEIAGNLKGYTGDDIRIFSKEVAMMPMRDVTENMRIREIVRLNPENLEGTIEKRHFDIVQRRVRGSIDPDMVRRHENWNDSFGSN